MIDTIDRIRSRGHWQVIIRPTRFSAYRVPNILDLERLVQESVVRLRGWYFPHVSSRVALERGMDYIGQASEWSNYLEVWRFFQSGQFYDLSGMWEDWLDHSESQSPEQDWVPGRDLGISKTVYRFSEIFEFAARLAVTGTMDDTVEIGVSLIGLERRALVVDDPNRWTGSSDLRATLSRFDFSRSFPQEQLIAESRDLALEPAREIFRRFGWDAPMENLREVQRSLRW